ncbi:Peroxisomal membrane protein 13 [Hibiscus syriacus]|uniref:Peroxin-13 n=1 Tax=Hibiscus syriacus TaxID=106335 RepID=A0A6A2ZTR4_HIBSY|nr:Peroxisomal membrane protein 13 [Hibiscus syriacus]
MDSNSQQAGGSPPKPWEQAGGTAGSGPFKPPSPGSTSDVVEASGTARPGEIVSTADATAAVNRNVVGRPLPSRSWEQQNYGSTYGGYGSALNYNSGYGSGMYGSSYAGGVGGFGGPMGGYGMGMGTYGEQDPNIPFGAPPSPPGFWISFLRVMQGVVNFFGRLFDRGGLLYGELARFVLRLLGIKTKTRKLNQPGPPGVPGPIILMGTKTLLRGQRLLQVVHGTMYGEKISMTINNSRLT